MLEVVKTIRSEENAGGPGCLPNIVGLNEMSIRRLRVQLLQNTNINV